MARKQGDNNYANYVGWQAFSTDEPCHRVNQTNWYLKFENGKPAFFINAENVYKQMPNKCFKDTCEKSHSVDMTGYQDQVKQYFNQSMEAICPIEVKQKMRHFSTV